MTDIEKAQKLSKELGHCLCHLTLPCPCPVFIKIGKCKCSEKIKDIEDLVIDKTKLSFWKRQK